MPQRTRFKRLASPVIPGLGMDAPELRRARALWQQNRFDESLHWFETAVAKYPQNRVALVDASRALGARFEITRAEAMLDRLKRLAGSDPGVLHLAGQSYRMIFRPEKAMACFRQVLARTKEIPDAFFELAVLYERRHRLDEAFALVNDCLTTAPDYLEAQLFKARLLRRMQSEAESEDLLRRLTDNERAHPMVQAQAWAEIALAQDRRGAFPAAMASILRCKELLLPHEQAIKRESDTVLRHLTSLAESLENVHFKRWKESTASLTLRKAAVLTGFPRSGTTLIEQVLDAHRRLVSSDEREAFARDIFPAMWLTPATPFPTVRALNEVPVDRIAHLRQRYWEYMAAALNAPIGDCIHLDKNPTLTLVLPGFLRLLPEAHVLVALRDPRDVVISCFMQYLPLNPNSVCFLTLERTARRYVADMSVWLRLRNLIASPWLELRYEDTVADLERETRRALEFLQLPWEPQVLKYRERLDQKVVNSPTYEAVRRPVYTHSIGRWRHYQTFLEPVLPILQPVIDALGY